MAKVKVLPEEFKALELYLSTDNPLEKRIKNYIESSYSWTNEYLPLAEMGFEKFVKCLINGYEIEYPPTPQLKTNKIDVSFNSTPEDLTKEHEIYLGLLNNGKLMSCKSFSIKEAMEIRNMINKLIAYYDDYCYQND